MDTDFGPIILPATMMPSALPVNDVHLGATGGTLETVILEEFLALGSPTCCQGCNRQWEIIEGLRIV